LLEFPKYCWTNDETFHGKVIVANYSNAAIRKDVNWKISRQDGTIFRAGTISAHEAANGVLFPAGEINADLSSIVASEKLTIHISINNTEYANNYPIWVYPVNAQPEIPRDIIVTEIVNDRMLAKLQSGTNVLLFPQTEDVKNNSFPGHFPPEFWNYGMFKGISERAGKSVSPGTLGLLTDPEHPVFNGFPTDFHTNWQWFSIIKASNSLILDSTAGDYYPIVQVIDNLERNHKLGLIFEFKVGQGKLLVCMSQLNRILQQPEAVQLYQSMILYMGSDDFNPAFSLSPEKLKELLKKI
jgi:hypothetical protein